MNSSAPIDLRIDWATHQAAQIACHRWHYSHSMPLGKLVKVGAWERGQFIGVVIFARGASPYLGVPYKLDAIELCELCRVALRDHVAPVSRIIALAVRFLRAQSTGLRLIVSFADPLHGHHGGIYQAAGWLYTGTTREGRFYRVRGKIVHPRSVGDQFHTGNGGVQSLWWVQQNLDPGAERVFLPGKHRYLLALDQAMRDQIEPLRQPYPKRAPPSSAVDRAHSPVMGAEHS